MGTDNVVFLEVIEWFDETGKELVHRIPEKGSGEIKFFGAQLTVRESQTALLRAAALLKEFKPLHDIWLVHFTGEEFPPDDLGAREFLARLMRAGQDITGLVLMDLIGWRAEKDDIFQVNPGDSAASMRMAAEAFDAARALRIKFRPKLRPRFDSRIYLYNTDGLLFSDTGYPVVLLNEHMNRLENLNRVGYHHTTDTSRKIDWEYAASIAKTAIETAARLSCTPPPASR